MSPQNWEKLVGVAPSYRFKLCLRVFPRVNRHAPLGTAVGQVKQSTFPGHPHSECPDFVNVNVGAETDPAFAGTTHQGVLDTVAVHHLNFPGVQSEGNRNRHLPGRRGEHVVSALVVVQELDSGSQLNARILQGVRFWC